MSLPGQTPAYYALNKRRYLRQDFIRRIEDHTNRELLVYFTNVSAPGAGLAADDTPYFAELLGAVQGDSCDLLIQSYGGQTITADKIICMLRTRLSDGYRVIVPERAKSAATLIALGANEILMGYTSELGPVDPLLPIELPSGQVAWKRAVPVRPVFD